MLTYYSGTMVDLIPIIKTPGSPLQYDFDLAKSIRLQGAHGEEIVRDAYTDIHVSLQIALTLKSSHTPRLAQHTPAAKTVTSAPGTFQQKRVWTSTTRRLNLPRRRARTKTEKSDAKRRRRSERAMRKRRRVSSRTDGGA